MMSILSFLTLTVLACIGHAEELVPANFWSNANGEIIASLEDWTYYPKFSEILQHMHNKGLKTIVVFNEKPIDLKHYMDFENSYPVTNSAIEEAEQFISLDVENDLSNFNKIEVTDASQLQNLKCPELEICVVSINGNSDAYIKAIQNKFGDKYLAAWTTSKVNHPRTITHKTDQLSRNRRGAADVKDDGSSIKYKFLTPAILMGLLSTFICVFILLLGVSALMTIQTPVRYQDAKIPLVGKEN